MKLQTAVEFLSTYGFMFLIVGLLLVIIFYFAFPAQTVVQNQCTVFGALQCNFAIFHTNIAGNNANVIFSVSNSGPAPINVISANVIVLSKTFTGSCTPNLLSPGSTSICHAYVTPSQPIGTQMHGYLSINVNYCNSDVSQFGNVIYQGNCTYSPLVYTGEFYSYANLITVNSVTTT